MIPSTIMNLAEGEAGPPPPELDPLLIYSLAFAMGLVLGLVLALPQWLVLRRHTGRAGWWIPANALAWALGMVVVFLGAGSVPDTVTSFRQLLIIPLSLAAAGAVVGAVHGTALVWLLRQRARPCPCLTVPRAGSPRPLVAQRRPIDPAGMARTGVDARISWASFPRA
jgi:hypothetical protein